MNCSFLKAAAVAVGMAILAATAGAASSFVSASPLPSVLSSPPCCLWIAGNFIVVWLWLVSSYRHRGAAVAAVLSSTASDVSTLMGGMLFPSSEPDVFAAAPDAVIAPPAPVSMTMSRPREARVAKKPVDRPRVRKKPAGEGTVGGAAAEAKPVGKKERSEEERPSPSTTEAEAVGVDDVSMDSAWQSIVRSGAARPVAVRKSETWGGEELPRMRRAADKAKAVVARREMRKSATMVPPSPPHPAAASSPVAARQGWRTRDVLGMAQDELLRRAESFIRRQHEHLRIQRQESEQRQAMEHDRRRRPAPIRV